MRSDCHHHHHINPCEFYTPEFLLRVFHWILSDSQPPQIFGTLLSILADINNPVV